MGNCAVSLFRGGGVLSQGRADFFSCRQSWDHNFFPGIFFLRMQREGSEKFGDRPSQTDGPLLVKIDTSISYC